MDIKLKSRTTTTGSESLQEVTSTTLSGNKRGLDVNDSLAQALLALLQTELELVNTNLELIDDTNTTYYITAIDEASATVTYVGKAAPGASAAGAVWRISKHTISGNVTTETMADGNSNFDNVWNNRAALSYS